MSRTRVSQLVAVKEYVQTLQERFVCRRCGKCCTEYEGVKLLKAEIRRMGVPESEWRSTFKMVRGHYVLKQPCRFYDAGQRMCRVYDNRPTVCRNFPVHNVLCNDGLIHLGVANKCQAALDILAQLEREILGAQAEEGQEAQPQK